MNLYARFEGGGQLYITKYYHLLSPAFIYLKFNQLWKIDNTTNTYLYLSLNYPL